MDCCFVWELLVTKRSGVNVECLEGLLYLILQLMYWNIEYRVEYHSMNYCTGREGGTNSFASAQECHSAGFMAAGEELFKRFLLLSFVNDLVCSQLKLS